jgi:hypothetical protein
MEADADTRALDALSKHPRAADLASLARSLLQRTAEAKATLPGPAVEELASGLGVTREDSATPFGNALDVLSRGPEDAAERALACALAAHALATKPPGDAAEAQRWSSDLLWLAAHTTFDATGLLDEALGSEAAPFWDAVAERVRRGDSVDAATAAGRVEGLLGAVALAGSRDPAAIRLAATLAAEVQDRKLARVLAKPAATPATEPLQGEMTAGPRGPALTALMAVTGLLLIVPAVRFAAALALGYRRPARVSLTDQGGLRVRFHTEILGRTMRDRDVLVPSGSLVRATRDVRFPSLAMYAGLLALAVGSYLGVATFVDGVRAASPSLLATGLAIVAVGLGLDFVLTSVAPGARGRCRVLFVARDGSPLCVGGVDTKAADALLETLARATRS